jgi:hypothetical protein
MSPLTQTLWYGLLTFRKTYIYNQYLQVINPELSEVIRENLQDTIFESVGSIEPGVEAYIQKKVYINCKNYINNNFFNRCIYPLREELGSYVVLALNTAPSIQNLDVMLFTLTFSLKLNWETKDAI